MTEITYKCIIGENISSPNDLIFERILSSKKSGVWIGYCEGDRIHPKHLIRIGHQESWLILKTKNDPFKHPNKKSNRKRFIEAKKKLRCPTGKVFMNYQKDLTRKFGMDAVDIYRCMGSRRGQGHRSHLVKIIQGTLDSNKMPIVLVVMEQSPHE